MQGPYDTTLGPPIVGAGTRIVDQMGVFVIKRLGLTALVVAGLLVTLGQARPQQPEAIRASKFVLVDANNRPRATLAMDNDSARRKGQ